MLDRKKHYGILKIALFQFIIFILCLVIVDIFLWLALPLPWNSLKKTFHQNLPGLKKEITYERNSFGFRSLSMKQKEKPDNTIRIFCLGASTTDQPTQAIEDTWCAILENELNNVFKEQNIRIQTAAYGRGAWKSTDLLFWAKKNLAAYNPDIVITLMGINDLSFNGGPKYSYSGIEDRLNALNTQGDDVKYFIKNWCKKYSQLCRRLIIAGRKIQIWRNKKTGKILEWHSKNLPNLRQDYKQNPYFPSITRNPDPLNEFHDAMSALLILLKKMNISTIVLGQPVLWKDSMSTEELNALWFYVNTPKGAIRLSGSWLVNEMHKYNNTQKQLAKLSNALYIDLDTHIPKTLAYYFDDCHYTDLGSRKLASAVFPLIKKQIEIMLSR